MNKKPILIVEDEPELGKVLLEGLSANGYYPQLAENAEKALKLFGQNPFDLVIADIRLPDMSGLQLLERLKKQSAAPPVILMTAFGTVQNAVEAMKKGAFDYLLKPFPLELLEEDVKSALCQTAGPPTVENFGPPREGAPPIITADVNMKEILRLCATVARSKATVLIQGESGTGKELLARYIHGQSPRKGGPFIAVNCASLPETLLESELFGHEKGAFTGAVARKIGKFELAHRGTILLDEISEMNTFLQAKILRVLQENEVDRIGGTRPIPIDIRVLATTNRDLAASVAKGEFREDLFYRLNVINISLPPLRKRPGDVDLLAQHFLKKFGEEYGKPAAFIACPTLEWLKSQEWKGNVRELRNALERAVLVSPNRSLSPADFSLFERRDSEGNKPEEGSGCLCLREMEQNLISKALEKTRGNRTHAAKILGISIRTLRNKLNEYKKSLPEEESFKLGQ